MGTLVPILLSNILGAALLAGVALLVGRFCRRPALLHCLWLLVLVKLVTPPLISVPLPWSATWLPDSLATHSKGPVILLTEVSEEGVRPDPLSPSAGSLSTDLSTQSAGTSNNILANEVQHIVGFLVGLWLLGTLWLYGRTLWTLRRFAQLLRWGTPAEEGLQERARQLAKRLGLGWCPEVFLLPGALPPLVWKGLASARIYLPAELLGRLSTDEIETLLAHELAHLRRRDHWVRWFEILVVGLFWWYPLAWWARWQLQIHEEECCDAWVVSRMSARVYAGAILETIDFLSETPKRLPALASGLRRNHPLKRRLLQILEQKTPRRLSLFSGAGVLAVVVLLPLFPVFASETKVLRVQAPQIERVLARVDEPIPTPNPDTLVSEEALVEGEPRKESRVGFWIPSRDRVLAGNRSGEDRNFTPMVVAYLSQDDLGKGRVLLVRAQTEHRLDIVPPRQVKVVPNMTAYFLLDTDRGRQVVRQAVLAPVSDNVAEDQFTFSVSPQRVRVKPHFIPVPKRPTIDRRVTPQPRD